MNPAKPAHASAVSKQQITEGTNKDRLVECGERTEMSDGGFDSLAQAIELAYYRFRSSNAFIGTQVLSSISSAYVVIVA